MKLANWGLAILLVSPIAMVASASAQSQDASQPDQQQDSLAAAARRAREQKKEEPKAAKVWDNDNLPSTPGTVSVVGGAGENGASETSGQSEQGQQQQGQQAANSNAPAPASDKEKAANAAELAADQDQLKSLKTDLDIAQRKLVLDQQMYYQKPDYASDKAGAAALKDEQDQIAAKQQQIDDLQKKIDALQSQSGAASDNSSTTNQNQ